MTPHCNQECIFNYRCVGSMMVIAAVISVLVLHYFKIFLGVSIIKMHPLVRKIRADKITT
jgi:hypothetical protein